ncbi:MAG: THUMP domain-containing protein [Candidatus Aenigmatarchaeota archaeon]
MSEKFLLTCDPGLEDIAEMEIREKICNVKISRFFNFQGKIIVETDNSKQLFNLHSIHHIIKLKNEFYLKEASIEEIKKFLDKIEIEELKDAESFRVTSQRYGNHNFTSIDMQKLCGEVFLSKYGKKVSLKNFDLNIRFDLIGNFGYIGIQLTKNSLYKRFKKIFHHTAAIKATLAYGMIRLAEVKESNSFLDPMCGSGTIVMEAAALFKDKVKIYGSDLFEDVIEKAKENAKLNNLDRYIEFKVADATRLEEKYSEIDRIVTNPPYGVKLGKRKDLKSFYFKFLESSSRILKNDSRMVLIILRADMFRIIIQRSKLFKVVHERVVESGGIFPHIFVLEKL